MESESSGYVRLEEQIAWYDRKSGAAQRNFKLTKYFTIFAAAAIPVVSIYGQKEIVAALGALIAIFEGASQVNQWQHNWITYRSTCEALRHEKYTKAYPVDPGLTTSCAVLRTGSRDFSLRDR